MWHSRWILPRTRAPRNRAPVVPIGIYAFGCNHILHGEQRVHQDLKSFTRRTSPSPTIFSRLTCTRALNADLFSRIRLLYTLYRLILLNCFDYGQVCKYTNYHTLQLRYKLNRLHKACTFLNLILHLHSLCIKARSRLHTHCSLQPDSVTPSSTCTIQCRAAMTNIDLRPRQLLR